MRVSAQRLGLVAETLSLANSIGFGIMTENCFAICHSGHHLIDF